MSEDDVGDEAPKVIVEGLTFDDLARAAAQLAAAGESPDLIYVKPEVVAELRTVGEHRRHWYWRVWYWLRYAPADLLDWLRARLP